MNAISGDVNGIAYTEGRLLQALHEGREAAMHMLYQGYAKPLYSYAVRITNDQEESTDIVNETFIQFFQHRGDFADLEKIKNFLFTITHNLSLNFLRNLRNRKDIEKEVFGPADGTETYIHNEALHSELTSYLHFLINQLPEKQRRPFARR